MRNIDTEQIAATFASTGTLAQFIHPAEASHGDLGMMSKDDLILLLSNSGETKELSDMIAYGKRNHMDIIGITQQEKSSLAKESTIQLVIPAVEEACPNRLAPTTSALIMLALGDALAMTLLKIKRFSPVDYKEFHPGGQLGKLLCRAHDLMHDHHLPLIKEDALMRDVLILMSRGRLGCAGIIGSHGELIGIITDGDLRRHMSEELFLEKAASVMTKNPKMISKDILAIDALRLMNEHSITCLFIVNEAKKPIGAIHVHDILKAGIA